MAIDMIVNPETANYLNAFLIALFAWGFIMCPYEFARGGKYQAPWFLGLPKNRRHRGYFLSQGLGLTFLVCTVVSCIVAPDSQLLTYQLACVNGLALLHNAYACCAPKDSAYGKVMPTDGPGRAQWRVNSFVIFPACFVVTLLACLHLPEGTVPFVANRLLRDAAAPTYVTVRSANIVALCLSSFFALMLTLAPRHMMSTWFVDADRDADDADAELNDNGDGGAVVADIELAPRGSDGGAARVVSAVPSASPRAGGGGRGGAAKAYAAGGAKARAPTVLPGGFVLLEDFTGTDYWLARFIGLCMLGCNLAMAIGRDRVDGVPALDHPLYITQQFVLFVVFTLHNLHGLTMRSVAGVAYVAKSWVPNLVMSVGVAVYFSLAFIEDKSL